MMVLMPEHQELDGCVGSSMLSETNQYLRARHGDGYMGFQNYRIVFSAHVTELSAGDWADWDENLQVEYRGRIVAGETGRELTTDYFAERHIIEMRRIPKYCEFLETPGFILEKWMGPAFFGSPSEWNSKVVEGTKLPMLGPYPHRGAYVSCLPPGVTPYPQAPTGPFLDRIIEQWEILRNEMLAQSVGAYVRKRTYDAENRDKLRSEKWNRETEQANMTALRPFFSTYLEGGKARQLAAEHAGLSSNYGN
jgi:hypothetical protein